MYCKNCGKKISSYEVYCKNCGKKIKRSFVSKLRLKIINCLRNKKKSLVILSIISILVLVIGSYLNSSIPNNSYEQVNLFSSVVNIFCDNENGGSGIMLLDDGTLMTNYHVVSDSSFCLVSIPDLTTGAPAEIYEAVPLIIPELSEEYDLAILSIDSVYTDTDGEVWGVYPKIFSIFENPTICENSYPQLGDSVKIYGYPVTSGGYNLTVTEGIISSFSDYGEILTSAKIDSGNSGGLAVDQNGCILGIPSAVLTGDYQNLGVIIPFDIVLEFIEKFSTIE